MSHHQPQHFGYYSEFKFPRVSFTCADDQSLGLLVSICHCLLFCYWQALFYGTTELWLLWRLPPLFQRQIGCHVFQPIKTITLNWYKYISSNCGANLPSFPVLGFQLFVKTSVIVFIYINRCSSKIASCSWNPGRNLKDVAYEWCLIYVRLQLQVPFFSHCWHPCTKYVFNLLFH